MFYKQIKMTLKQIDMEEFKHKILMKSNNGMKSIY